MGQSPESRKAPEVVRRPKRKSDPVRPRAPQPRQADSWEYPLSREEKKYRVMCLFEQELNEAKQCGAEEVEALLDENEALYAQLEELEERRSSQEEAAAEATRRPTLELEDGKGRWRNHRFYLLAVLVLAFSAAATLAAAFWSAESRLEEGHELLSTSPEPPNVAAAAAEPPHVEAAAAEPPNVAAAARRLQAHGMARLAVSDCWKADWYFSSALKLLEEQVALQEGAAAESLSRHILNLLGDRGFSLVCAQRFPDGVATLERHLAGTDVELIASHVLNALGYARFMLQDFSGALLAFNAGLQKDDRNPILWNNLAAAHMVLGHIQEADDAMFKVGEFSDHEKQTKGSIEVSEYHEAAFLDNVQELMNRANGQATKVPSVELWWGGAVADEL